MQRYFSKLILESVGAERILIKLVMMSFTCNNEFQQLFLINLIKITNFVTTYKNNIGQQFFFVLSVSYYL